MNEHVLVAVDLSPHAVEVLRHGVQQARWRDATLEVFHAYPSAERVAAFPVPPERGSDRSDPAGQRAAALARLEAWLDASGVDRTGLDVTTVVAPARRAGRAIVERAVAANLVVVGARRRVGIAAPVLGSVSEHVLRRSPAPVLLVRIHRPTRRPR